MKNIKLKGYFVSLNVMVLNDEKSGEVTTVEEFYPVVRARKNTAQLPPEILSEIFLTHSSKGEAVVLNGFEVKTVTVAIREQDIYLYGKIVNPETEDDYEEEDEEECEDLEEE